MFSHSKILFLVPLLCITSIPTYFNFLIILVIKKFGTVFALKIQLPVHFMAPRQPPDIAQSLLIAIH